MIYVATITTPANTAETAAVKTIMPVVPGLIFMIEVEFPAGCVGLLRVRVMDGPYQVCPSTRLESLRGDNVVLRFDDSYLKESAPNELEIVTWNTDTVYPHSCQVRIGIAASELFMARYLPSLAWEDFRSQLAAAATLQAQINEASLEGDLSQFKGG